jgi:16S rRNA (cytosine(967)-C(5))-methyltransferase
VIELLKEAWMLAIETLSWMEMRKLGERLALARTVKQLNIDNTDSARLAHRLVSETVRRRNFIDRFIGITLKPHELGEFDLGIQAFLRLYVCQTRLTKNWAKADIKEAEHIIRLARSILSWKTLEQVEPFLGVLLTEKPDLVFENVNDEQRVGLQTFHPAWFVRYCFKLFGRSGTIAMLEADKQESPTYVRVNTLKLDAGNILERLAKESINVEKVEGFKYVYRVIGSKQPMIRTASHKEGLFYIQDKSSCFVVEVADPKPGMTALDVCAAPGAKTTYLAQLMQNKGVIYSLDYSRRRMRVWKNEVVDMDTKIAEPIIANACFQLPLDLQVDVLILDPPCTSTGTFRKSPSEKWRLTSNSIGRMAEIQWRMLNGCADSVKPGGILIYSTNSLTIEENEMQIERFLKWHADFSLEQIAPSVGSQGLRGLEKCRRFYPHIHECNGSFVAKLVKNRI